MFRYKWYPSHYRLSCINCFTSRCSPPCFTDFCRWRIFSYSLEYAIILGIIGSVMNFNEMKRIITAGCELPCHLSRVRKLLWVSISNHHYRDIQLACNSFAFAFYLMLLFGSICGTGCLLVPWLIFDGVYLVFEICSTSLSMVKGDTALSKSKHIFLHLVLVYNWLSIFCASLHRQYCH